MHRKSKGRTSKKKYSIHTFIISIIEFFNLKKELIAVQKAINWM